MQLLQQWCNVVITTDAVDQLHYRVENGLQSAELTGRKSSQDSVAVVQLRYTRATTSRVKDSCDRDRGTLSYSCRSEAKQPATTLVMCVDMVKPLSIHTPRSRTTDDGPTELPQMRNGRKRNEKGISALSAL